jgi:hypothetical protein
LRNEIVLRQSDFEDCDTAGFGVSHIRDRDTVPVVSLATVDFSNDAEGTVELRAGESFQIAGETWQLTEVRSPATRDWAVFLRRTATDPSRMAALQRADRLRDAEVLEPAFPAKNSPQQAGGRLCASSSPLSTALSAGSPARMGC